MLPFTPPVHKSRFPTPAHWSAGRRTSKGVGSPKVGRRRGPRSRPELLARPPSPAQLKSLEQKQPCIQGSWGCSEVLPGLGLRLRLAVPLTVNLGNSSQVCEASSFVR